tara:strand:+ start:866 stop:1309 length:444 start_codon:yes stop_codon:yes gene_type:complete
MIQFTQQAVPSVQSVRANLYDVMTNSDEYNPLIVYKSQFTGYTKISLATSVYWNSKDRYVGFQQTILKQGGTEDLSAGEVLFGTKNFPFGFYDVTIYQNNNNTNMDVANTIKVVCNTLLNVSSFAGTVDYKEYTTNDSDTESVYITI